MERKVQTGIMPGMECKLQHENASVLILHPHIELRTNSEETEFESNRDEWE